MTCEIFKIYPLPCCSKTLKIGKFSAARSNVYAIFTNLTTNNQIVKQFNTDGSGNIVIDVTDINFPTDQPYQIYFEGIAGYYSTDDKFSIDGSDPMPYVLTRFEKKVNADGSEFEIIQGIARLMS
jgi:hypothetical protein